jgi:hypothetical protein
MSDFRQLRDWYAALPADLELEVTGKDIHDGISINCQKCPLALAAKRLMTENYPLPWGTLITMVAGSSVSFYCDGGRAFIGRYWFGDDGNKFVHRFDSGRVVKPQVIALHKPGRLG